MRAVTALATTVGLLVLFPAGASAANTLRLSTEPAIPKKGQPFSFIAQGNLDHETAALTRGFAPGDASCPSTAELATAGQGVYYYDAASTRLRRGPFDKRRVFSGSGGQLPDSAYLNRGLAVGRYYACGYVHFEGEEDRLPIVAARMEFTVGGTCASSTDAVTRARSKLNRARASLRKARRSGNARAIRRARTRVSKAKRALKRAQADRKALC
jgi:hypothetical protein